MMDALRGMETSTHGWDVSTQEALRIQERLRDKVVVRTFSQQMKTVAGVDVAAGEQDQIAAIGIFNYESLELMEESVARAPASFPYVPGLLTFREGPVILKAFFQLKHKPDVIIFDGQGIAHPRGLGIASHLGVILNRPTIGCAKSRLVGEYRAPDQEKGCLSPLLFQNRTIGAVVRTRPQVKPVFVSPGHLMDVTSAAEIVLHCCRRYRLPEPIRWAHRRAQIRQNR